MGDLAAMIMSMDTLQLSGIGLATMGSIGLLAYGVLRKKSSKEHPVERASALSDAALRSNKPRVEKTDDESYDIDSQEELPHLKQRSNEVKQPAKPEDAVGECIESALVYDGYGSKDEAGQMLREAMEQESHQKEKVRLHVIYKNYMSGTEPLSALLERYPTFIKKQISVDNEQQRVETKEQFDLFATKKDNISPVQVPQEEKVVVLSNEEVIEENVVVEESTVEVISESEITNENREESNEDDIPVLTEKISFEEVKSEPDLTEEASFAEMKAESDRADQDRAEDEADAVQSFFKEFGSLAQQIQAEREQGGKNIAPQPVEQVYIPTPEKDIHDVWANYMSLYGGRMNLKNTFIHLDHAWGTIPGIAELQEKINHEIGKDANGNQIPWAIISVLPIKDADKQ